MKSKNQFLWLVIAVALISIWLFSCASGKHGCGNYYLQDHIPKHKFRAQLIQKQHTNYGIQLTFLDSIGNTHISYSQSNWYYFKVGECYLLTEL